MKKWTFDVTALNFINVDKGRKIVETRALDPTNPDKDYEKVQEGDILSYRLVDVDYKPIEEVERIEFFVTFNHIYDDPRELLENEGLNNVFPDHRTIEAAIEEYHSYTNYTRKMKEYGMIAFGIGDKV